MVGLSSFVALLLGVTLWLLFRDDSYVAPPPSGSAQRIEPAPAAALLPDLVEAVRAGDEDAAADLASTGDATAQEQLRTFVTNAEAIGLRDVSLRYLDELGGIDATGEWSATATLTWRFDSFDTMRATTEVQVDFLATDTGVAIAGLGGTAQSSGSATPIWFADPVEVRRTAQTLVIAVRRVADYALLARRAVPIVRTVVPEWPGGLVIEVPASAAGLDAALGADRGTYENVAGVTAPVDGTGSLRSPVHVFLNPARIRDLRPAGAQVVVSHEAAHVALDATASSLPVWLSEGFADYVALRDVGLPLSTTAGQIIRQVRREGPPASLPGDVEFDEESEYFGAAYEASWFACRLLAARVGESALLSFYRQADGSEDFRRLFRRTFGLTEQAFTEQWQAALVDVAR